ncbi:HET-domain-containing protein [Corynespora cassiicola Philippines]|uniref:HET-domain-containing protein n=1 Tax=Corynespora cassiicola Philippines TaxID=1448308 RepID=A0A2T2NF87_CORCC|nr:HET-domain-containing protein [Corynespora cassiicola Philippines]
MPVTKSLRPRRQPSGRKHCRLCHNFDPLGLPTTIYKTGTAKESIASANIICDGLDLSRTKDPAEGGCRFCLVLIQALDAFFEGWRGARQKILLEFSQKGPVKASIDGDSRKGQSIEIYAGAASRAPWPTLGTARHIPINAGSDDTFNFARRCIQDCLTNPKHTKCREVSRSSSTTPKRLLDVGRITAPIRLIDTQGKAFQYASLSHCWGAGPTLTATKSNWKKLASNISFDGLPPLFQDAIIITRQLGLRYIWIDSLCIIQDSTRDWETEASKMAGIYENSHVTISAAGCKDGSGRCLVDRRKPVKINYENTTGKEFQVRARLVENHHPDVAEQEPATPHGTLASRAWVLQERVLSTRILHYTATELLFECKTSYRCECRPARRPYPTFPAMIPKAIAHKKNDCSKVWDAWHRIVEQYSAKDLTVPGDKLPAISGIASKIKEGTGSSYLAGLWKDHLAADLLWFVSTAPDHATRPHHYALGTYRAPTWSWASLDAPVSYYTPSDDERDRRQSLVRLVSSSITLAGLNSLGAVSDISLRVNGPTVSGLLCSAQSESLHRKWEYTLLVKGTSAIRILHDCPLVDRELDSGPIEKSAQRARSSDTLRQFKAPVMCLSVERYESWISGLVLGQSERVPGAWERLGTFAAGAEGGFQRSEKKEITLV